MPRQLWWVKQLRRCGFGLSATTFARLAGLYLPAIQYDMQTCLAQHRFKSAMKSWTIYNYINTHQREQKRLGTSWNIILWLKHFSETVTSVVRLAASESLPNSFNSSSLWTLMKADNTTISTNPKGNPNGKEQYCKTWVPARNSSYVLLCLHQRFFANKSRSAVGSHCGRMKVKHIRKRTAYDSPMAIYLAYIYNHVYI